MRFFSAPQCNKIYLKGYNHQNSTRQIQKGITDFYPFSLFAA